MLKINNLTVKVLDKVILDNFNLEIKPGEIHVLMGQNGAGKSTISKVILRDENYMVTTGSISYKNQDLLVLNTTDVARLGIFMVNQNPIEIEGVTNAEMLRTALNDMGKNNLNILEFNRKMTDLCEKLNIPSSFIHRDINYNMSGGEKKKNELLHLWMLEPDFIILDEIDSGLDVDSLKLVANSILEYYKKFNPSILIITHQKSLLDILKPDYVHVLNNKKITESGDYNLALDIFKNGFSRASIMSESDNHE
jgi:Fe-S cluster assembly ATP-binding protein